MRAAAVLALALFGLGSSSPSHAACQAAVRYQFNTPVEIEGTIKTGIGKHEAQGEFFYAYLVLDKPVCVDPPPEGGDQDFGTTATEKPLERIQVGGEASQRDMPEDGARILVKGKLFGAHTAWHVEPVLIDAETITAISTN